MIGFFLDVLEVESVENRKDRAGSDYQVARLRLAGGVLAVRVRQGVKIVAGWSGKASGSARIVQTKREFNRQFYDVVSLQPIELDTWVPLQQVQQNTLTAMDAFIGRK